MTKSAKHKKEFRKEKNKIKLKLSAKATKQRIGKNKKTTFLPKGLNVTDTSFKSKKIVLPSDHLRPDDDSGIPLSNKKQTFKELISHMGHFNTTVQQDGVNGMRELLNKFPETLETNLSPLFNKLVELVSGGDSGVRKCSLKLLEYILQIVPHEKISPFFPLLNAQLMCCMNHISLEIQKDSHLLLDTLLNCVPQLVSTVVMQVLPNFIEQISCRDDSKAGKRILAMNPNQRLTSLKWRQEVLMRVHRLLVLLISRKPTECHSAQLFVTYDPQRHTCPLYIARDFDLKSSIEYPNHFSVGETAPAIHPLQEFVTNLLPLLIETWIEAMASEQLNKNQGESLIRPENCALLSCSINVFLALWNIFKQSENRKELLAWFEKHYGESVMCQFIQRFPFSARIETRQNRGKSANKVDPQCREQNIALCYIWTQFLGMKSANKYAPVIFQYLSGLFQDADHRSLTSSELDQLKSILITACSKKHLFGFVDTVVRDATEYIERVRPDRRDRILLSTVLMEVGQNVDKLDEIPFLRTWIENCPSLIHQDANGSLLSCINEVMKRNPAALENGRKQVSKVLAALENYGPQYDWKAVFDFLYWTRTQHQYTDEYSRIIKNQIERIQDPVIKNYGSGVINVIMGN